MICFGLLIMFCDVPQPAVTDSFCAVYQPVVQEKGDGTIAGTKGAKRRLLANELTYRKLCPKR